MSLAQYSPSPYVWIPPVRGMGVASTALSTAEQYAIKYKIVMPWRGLSGLGQITTPQLESLAATGASLTVGILVALGTIGGPIGAAIGGVIAAGAAIASLFKGCGQTCIVATQDANKVGALMNQNAQAYFNSPVHYKSLQQAALNNVTTLIKALQQACSDPALGSAGQRCISERLVRGGTAPWCPNQGHTGCDYYATFYDPIANDPKVVPDPVAQSSNTSASASTSGSTGSTVSGSASPTPDLAPLLLIAALLGVALIL